MRQPALRAWARSGGLHRMGGGEAGRRLEQELQLEFIQMGGRSPAQPGACTSLFNGGC
jgi:hypothetical protein